MIGLPLPAERPDFNLGDIGGDYRFILVRLREWELCMFHQKIVPFQHGCAGNVIVLERILSCDTSTERLLPCAKFSFGDRNRKNNFPGVI